MRPSRGRLCALVFAAAAAAFLGMAGYAARHRILEAWHLHRLEAADPAARLRAIEALGRIGSARAVPDLCRLLDSTTREERIAAAEAVGAIGPEAEEAVMPLVRLFFSEPDPSEFTVERSASGALARIGPTAIPAILEADHGLVPAKIYLLLAFEEGLLPLADLARSAPETHARRWYPRRKSGERRGVDLRDTALETLVHLAEGVLAVEPAEVARLIPLLNRWRVSAHATELVETLPLALLSSDPLLAQRLAAGADVQLAIELRSTCLMALSTLGADAASALPFLLDGFDDKATRSLAAHALGRVGVASVGPLVTRVLQRTRSDSFQADLALVDAGMIYIDAARAIVRVLPAADDQACTRLTGVLDRIGANAVTALEEASRTGDTGLQRAARAALLECRDRRAP